MNRFIIEFGFGIDFHGQDVNHAAEKAVKDAISHGCLCGLEEVVGVTNPKDQIAVHVMVAVSRPKEIDVNKIAKLLPIGKVDVKMMSGGMRVPGLYVPELGDKDDSIEAAIACVEVEVIR